MSEENGVLKALSLDAPLFEFRLGALTVAQPLSATEFYVAGRYHTRLSFTLAPDGRVMGATLNPGQWAQVGKRLPE